MRVQFSWIAGLSVLLVACAYGRRCCAAEWTCAGRDGDERSFQRSARRLHPFRAVLVMVVRWPVVPVGGGACIIGLNCGCIRGITCPGTVHHPPAPASEHPPDAPAGPGPGPGGG